MGETRRTSKKREIVFYQYILAAECCVWKTLRVRHRALGEDQVTPAQQEVATGSDFHKEHFKMWWQPSIWPYHTLIKEAERGNNSQNGALWGLRRKFACKFIRFSWMVWLIFDARWHIGRFWFVTTRLNICFGSELFLWRDLFITEGVEEMKGLHGNHIGGLLRSSRRVSLDFTAWKEQRRFQIREKHH